MGLWLSVQKVHIQAQVYTQGTKQKTVHKEQNQRCQTCRHALCLGYIMFILNYGNKNLITVHVISALYIRLRSQGVCVYPILIRAKSHIALTFLNKRTSMFTMQLINLKSTVPLYSFLAVSH